jgi:hypothetical protein
VRWRLGLSLILPETALLADDGKMTDPVILRQFPEPGS